MQMAGLRGACGTHLPLRSCRTVTRRENGSPKWCRTSSLPHHVLVGRASGDLVMHENQIEGLDAKQKNQVSCFVDALLDWNQRMNLTAVTDRDAVIHRHVLDSLALLPVLETSYAAHCCGSGASAECLKVVDVGSGAGLPGLILAIARPGAPHADATFSLGNYIRIAEEHVETMLLANAFEVTLLESLQKRCNFLNFAVEKSGLSNVTVVRARAEESGQDKKFRGVYDVAVARAVAEMRVLSELCLPLVRVGGIFVAAKGPDSEEEVNSSMNAIRLLGASLLSLSTVASVGPLGQRTAAVCYKKNPTPAKYPRKPGTPGKSPL